MNGYLEYIEKIRRYSPRTVAIYADVLRRYAEFTEPLQGEQNQRVISVQQLDVQSLRAYEVHLLDDLGESPRTVALHMSVLGGYCRYLMRKGILSSNPVKLVSRPKQEKRLPEFFRNEALESYYESTKGVPEFGNYGQQLSRMVVSMLYNTGVRRAELISLNRSSLDMSRRTLRVRGKGDKLREIPLTASFCKEISLYLQSVDSLKDCVTGPEAPLLQTESGGRLYPMLVERIVKQELGSVGTITSRKSPHVLRHTLATELLNDGADLNSIKELLGHSSLAATQVYTHNSIERLKSVYNNAHPRAKNGGKNGNQD